PLSITVIYTLSLHDALPILAQLGLSPFFIGIVLTLTVLSSAVYTFVISFLADRIGRRKTLIFFALTDAVAGGLLLTSTGWWAPRSEEHTSELQSRFDLVCRL